MLSDVKNAKQEIYTSICKILQCWENEDSPLNGYKIERFISGSPDLQFQEKTFYMT